MDFVLVSDDAGTDGGDTGARRSITAAAASSHDDSIPKISIGSLATVSLLR